MSVIETILVHEIAGTAFLTLLGCGVVANVLLNKTNGNGSDGIVIFFGWGLAVFCAVYVAYDTGAHLNPAVTLGLLIGPAKEYAEGIPINLATTVTYLAAEFIGGFLGAVVCFLAYKKQYDDTQDGALKLATFSTAPTIRSYAWNLLSEIIGTFVLIFVIIMFGHTPSGLGPLAVALLVVSIGASLGGPTGYAINPARDLGPRIAHAVLPIQNKGSNDWRYAWVPVVGPVIGSAMAALVAYVY
ncbi:glycerol uptake facilitator protein [Chromohalobacter marismortui]|uniref:Glycerol uptake facilitator protein n=1 Tax=Chromohalobacter marismortui TaxID=42055 RepID=A0A4R7NPK3_9GAMM|nr:MULTISPECIES: MIP/aquaporin family protein [Chromohalobacter]MCI0508815.1 aquaporin family protein [Chromohalobacter sp.]MCI0594328.1 aquaporin family protein [Chromohalobacter sp.]TDU22813.1 glycerol uptake facilitator protein [Chromohalobacter marismortui]